MTGLNSKVQALTSLAILKANWDRGQDYIENFVPFIAQALVQRPHAEVSLPMLQEIVRQEFGLNIPQGPLKTILRRAARRNYVKHSQHVYIRNDKKCQELDFNKTQETVLRQHNNLIAKLMEFLKVYYDLHWSNKQAEEALLECLARHTLSTLRIEKDDHTGPEPKRPVNKEIEFLIRLSAFLLWRGQAKWIHSTRPWSVRIDAATILGHKRAGFLLIIIHFQENNGVFKVFIKRRDSVFLQKLPRRNSEIHPEPDYVIGRKKDINIAAAFIEAGDGFVAIKCETAVFG